MFDTTVAAFADYSYYNNINRINRIFVGEDKLCIIIEIFVYQNPKILAVF